MKPIKRPGTCLCGLKIRLHFDAKNCMFSCDQAKAAHPRAKLIAYSFTQMLENSGGKL